MTPVTNTAYQFKSCDILNILRSRRKDIEIMSFLFLLQYKKYHLPHSCSCLYHSLLKAFLIILIHVILVCIFVTFYNVMSHLFRPTNEAHCGDAKQSKAL